MLKKDLTVPGAKIRTRAVLKDGLTGPIAGDTQNEVVPHLEAWPASGGASLAQTPAFLIQPNQNLEVVEKPKKRGGVNMCRVKDSTGLEGHVFWCALRMSCDHI